MHLEFFNITLELAFQTTLVIKELILENYLYQILSSRIKLGTYWLKSSKSD